MRKHMLEFVESFKVVTSEVCTSFRTFRDSYSSTITADEKTFITAK